jgi:hypothetical protein
MKRGTDKYYIKEAFKKYTEGIEQEFDDNELKAKLHSNRAQVNLKLSMSSKILFS